MALPLPPAKKPRSTCSYAWRLDISSVGGLKTLFELGASLFTAGTITVAKDDSFTGIRLSSLDSANVACIKGCLECRVEGDIADLEPVTLRLKTMNLLCKQLDAGQIVQIVRKKGAGELELLSGSSRYSIALLENHTPLNIPLEDLTPDYGINFGLNQLRQFLRLASGLMAEEVRIGVRDYETGRYVSMNCAGTEAQAECLYKQTSEVEGVASLEQEPPESEWSTKYSEQFSITYLNSFVKAIDQAVLVELHLTNGKPLLVRIELGGSDKSVLNFLLAPKNEGDD
jgi:hypothetical protein